MLIPIEKLKDNKLNPNVMPDEIRAKLKSNIKAQGGRYPAIIVRKVGDDYRIIDGHNRRRVLKELEFKEVECDVWDIDDKTEMLLLATLNELKGTQNLTKRAELLQTISELGIARQDLLKLIPEDNRRLDFILSIVESRDLSEITDITERRNAEVEAERRALTEKFIAQGIDPKKAAAMADIYAFKKYVPQPDKKVEGMKVGTRPLLVFFFDSKEDFEIVAKFFEAENEKEPNTHLLVTLVKNELGL